MYIASEVIFYFPETLSIWIFTWATWKSCIVSNEIPFSYAQNQGLETNTDAQSYPSSDLRFWDIGIRTRDWYLPLWEFIFLLSSFKQKWLKAQNLFSGLIKEHASKKLAFSTYNYFQHAQPTKSLSPELQMNFEP